MVPLVLLSSSWLLGACDRGPQLRGRISALHEKAREAEEAGAKRCAPRELALTHAYLQFAELELAKGKLSQAESFTRRAELNAAAAALQSPAALCGLRLPQPGDRDGDGFEDAADRCPDQPENFQGYRDQDGCPDDGDIDGDGVLDSIDACIVHPEDADDYLDEDGCPEADNDLDGVLDHDDKCQNEAEDPDGYEDADGCPDPDNDGDEVPDLQDQCPNTPGQRDKDPLGCPVKPALVVVTDCEVKITQQIHFAYNKAIIKPESFPILDAVKEVLVKNESIKLEIQGHTDDRGSEAYNNQLSDQRASAVRKYLVANGVAAVRLESHGYGEERPLVDNDTESSRALNRRVQFIRTEGQKTGCGQNGQPVQTGSPSRE